MIYEWQWSDVPKILLVAFLMMSYFSVPSSNVAIDMIKEKLIKKDEYGRAINEEQVNMDTYSDDGLNFTKCLSELSSFARVIKSSHAKYYVCSKFTGKTIVKATSA